MKPRNNTVKKKEKGNIEKRSSLECCWGSTLAESTPSIIDNDPNHNSEKREKEMEKREKEIEKREKDIEKRAEDIEKRAKDIEKREKDIEKREEDIGKIERDIKKREKDIEKREKDIEKREEDIEKRENIVKIERDIEKRENVVKIQDIDKIEEDTEEREEDTDEIEEDIEKRAVGDIEKRVGDIEKREEDIEKRERDTEKRERDIEKREKDIEKREEDIEKREEDKEKIKEDIDPKIEDETESPKLKKMEAPLVTPVTIEILYNHLECVNHMAFATIVDLRCQSDFNEGHIPGAFSIPLESVGEVSKEFLFEKLTKKGQMILEPNCKYFFYSSSDFPSSTLSTLTTTLQNQNKKCRFYILQGGYQKWHSSYSVLCESEPPSLRIPTISIRVFPSVIIPDFLYLGCVGTTHPQVLNALGIRFVLSAAREVPKLRLVNQMRLELTDNMFQPITIDIFKKSFKFINKAAKKKKKSACPLCSRYKS